MFAFSSPRLLKQWCRSRRQVGELGRAAEVEVHLRVPGEPDPGAGVELVKQPEVDAPAPGVVVQVQLCVGFRPANRHEMPRPQRVRDVDRHLVFVDTVHGVDARPEREFVGHLAGDGGQERKSEQRRLLHVVAADPVVVVLQRRPEVAGHCEPEFELRRHAVAEEAPAAGKPAVRAERVAAVVSAERRTRCPSRSRTWSGRNRAAQPRGTACLRAASCRRGW